MANPQQTAIIDLDGTLIERHWPEMGDWMPGARSAMFALHDAGIHLKIHSCRLSPWTPYGMTREPHEVATEIQKLRYMLDQAGLTFVDIWTKPGKPSGMVYVDDKAERYAGRPGSWKAMVEKIIVRVGAGDPTYAEEIWLPREADERRTNDGGAGTRETGREVGA